jgi:hypothetical protein
MVNMANYRHGDLALVSIEKIPTGLKESESKILLEGKSNTHSFDRGKLYEKKDGQFIIGYFEAVCNTKLFHIEHGKGEGKLKKAKIKKGYYELRRQVEDTHEGMRPVVD